MKQQLKDELIAELKRQLQASEIPSSTTSLLTSIPKPVTIEQAYDIGVNTMKAIHKQKVENLQAIIDRDIPEIEVEDKRIIIPLDKANRMFRPLCIGKHEGKWFFRTDWWIGGIRIK